MPWSNGDVVRCRLNASLSEAGISLNIFHFELQDVLIGPIEDEEMEGAVADYLDNITAGRLDHFSSGWAISSFDLYKLSGEEWDWVSNAPHARTGTGGASILPAGVAAVMTAYTLINRVFGRKFLAGLTETVLVEGLWGASFLADLAAMAAAYITPHTDPVLEFTIQPGIYSTTRAEFIPFTLTALVTNIPGYQRRRKTGVGQ